MDDIARFLPPQVTSENRTLYLLVGKTLLGHAVIFVQPDLSSRALPGGNSEAFWQVGRGLIGRLDRAAATLQCLVKEVGRLLSGFFFPLLPEPRVAGTLHQILHDPFPEEVGEGHPIDHKDLARLITDQISGMQIGVADDVGEGLGSEHPRQLFERGHHHVDRRLMRQPAGAKRPLGGTLALGMGKLGLEGTDPARVLLGVKGLLALRRKASRWQRNLVNASEDRSHLLPLLLRHPRQAAIPRDPGVDDHGPFRKRCPQRPTLGRKGSHDGGDPLIEQIARNQTAWFVKWSRGDFEQIGRSPLVHRTIHPGVVIMSQGEKRQCDEAQLILVLHTSSKVFLCNLWRFTNRDVLPILSVLSLLFKGTHIHSLC